MSKSFWDKLKKDNANNYQKTSVSNPEWTSSISSSVASIPTGFGGNPSPVNQPPIVELEKTYEVPEAPENIGETTSLINRKLKITLKGE